MRNLSLLISILFLFSCVQLEEKKPAENIIATEPEKAEYALAIHGGAGTIKKENMTPEREKEIMKKLKPIMDQIKRMDKE